MPKCDFKASCKASCDTFFPLISIHTVPGFSLYDWHLLMVPIFEQCIKSVCNSAKNVNMMVT